MREQTADQIITDLDEALRAVIAKHDGGVVTKWYLCVKVQGSTDATSGTWLLSPPTMDEQDELGILNYALVDTKARLYSSFLNEEDEED